jgi:hypothetical protein
MKIRLTTRQLELLTDFCNDYNVEIRLDYSGRGMFSSECIGFVFDSETNEYKFLMELTEFLMDYNEDNLLDSLKSRICSDSMGRGTIIYFPNVQEPEQNDTEQAPVDVEPSEYLDQHNP